MASIQQHNQVIVLPIISPALDFPIVHWSNLIRGSWSTWASDSNDKVRVWSESDREKLQHSTHLWYFPYFGWCSCLLIQFLTDLTSWSWVLWCYLYFEHQYLFQILCDKNSKANLDREIAFIFNSNYKHSVADMLLPRNAGSPNYQPWQGVSAPPAWSELWNMQRCRRSLAAERLLE